MNSYKMSIRISHYRGIKVNKDTVFLETMVKVIICPGQALFRSGTFQKRTYSIPYQFIPR